MKKTRLDNMSKLLLDELRAHKEFSEEQVLIFFDGLIDSTQGEYRQKESKEYTSLRSWINEKWVYRELDDLSHQLSFLLGALWGGITLRGMKNKRKKEELNIDQLVTKYRNNYWFFNAIANQPGIMHKQLAEKGGITSSELSQFATRIYKEDLFSYNRVGREKYYFLQQRGEEVYKRLKQARKARRGLMGEIVNSDGIKEHEVDVLEWVQYTNQLYTRYDENISNGFNIFERKSNKKSIFEVILNEE